MQVDTLPFLDITAPDFEFDSPAVHEAREKSWLARTPIGFAALRYDDVATMLKDGRLHQGSQAILAMRGVTSGPLVDWWTKTILNIDGAEHTRLRRLVAKVFTPPSVERLRPFFRATAENLIDGFATAGPTEFVQKFSEPYPLAGICEMLGIPHERRASFYGWAGDLGLIFSKNIGQADVRAKAEAALLALYACADEVIADRMREPGPDLVSALIEAEAEGDKLTIDELRGMIAGLVFAGNDTTRNQLGLGMIAFSQHPEQWAALVNDPGLASRAVDEMMRLHPTISVVPRIVREEGVEYHGFHFKPGFVIALILASANTDRHVFGDAPFDITVERPASHLTFSGGIHRCLGMWLAKAEMQDALVVLSERFKTVEAAGEPTWQPGLGIDGPTTLPLTLPRTKSPVPAPNPNVRNPIANVPRVQYIKPFITSALIEAGDYSYYDDPGGAERFETENVLYHYGPEKLVIGRFCAIATGVRFIMNGANHRMDGISTFPFPIFGAEWSDAADLVMELPNRGDTVVGNDVWMGYEAAIAPGVRIGNGAIVATRSVVTKDVRPYAIVGGNPAVEIRRRYGDDEVDTLQRIAWWDWPIERITDHVRVLMTADVKELRSLIGA